MSVRYKDDVFIVVRRSTKGLGLRVIRASKTRPKRLDQGEVCVRIPLSIATQAFEPRLVVPEQSIEIGDCITATVEKTP